MVGGTFVIWIFWSIGRGLKAWKRHRLERRRLREHEATELTDILDDDEAMDEDEDEDEEDDDEPSTGHRASAEELVGVGPVDGDPVERVEREERFIVPRTHSDTPGGRRTLASESKEEEQPESQLDANPVAVLLSDEPGGDPEWSPDSEWSARGGESSTEDAAGRQRFTPRPKVLVLGEDEHPFTELGSETADGGGETENALQNQADGLQKQIAEFRELAQGAEQAKQAPDSPVGDTLKELAQQVSAIREYAASQQNRVEKLQDGYDWTIIRTFCLRVIRCIDNLENRIERLVETDNGTGDLEEVRDELLFALESSGIEQFRPELNSDYRGQEKLAEAVKERQTTKKTDRIGKIAKVVRPGYRYIIDEETCKIVRTAQVKLFG